MKQKELLHLFNQQQRIEMEFPGARREAEENVIRYIPSAFEDGFISYSNLDESNVEATIEAQVAYFAGLGLAFEWKVYSYDRPPDLKDRLSAHGFQIEDAEALLVLDLAEHDVLLQAPIPPAIWQISKPEQVDAMMALEAQVWGTDHHDLGERLKTDLAVTPRLLSAYAAFASEKMVSAAWMYFHPGSQFASLWGGSTLEGYRHQGYYRGLLAARAQEAWQAGFRFLSVDASPMSRPILEKHGFQFLAYSYPCRLP